MSARRKRRKVSSGAAVALVSDTHGVVDEILLAGLRNQPLDAVIHPGDIGDVKRKSRLSGEQVLQALQAAAGGAALSAVLGNVDEPDAALVGNGSVGLTAVVEQLGIRMLIKRPPRAPEGGCERERERAAAGAGEEGTGGCVGVWPLPRAVRGPIDSRRGA